MAHLYNQIAQFVASHPAKDYYRYILFALDIGAVVFLVPLFYISILLLALIAIEKPDNSYLLERPYSGDHLADSVRLTLRRFWRQDGLLSLWRGFGLFLLLCGTFLLWLIVLQKIMDIFSVPDWLAYCIKTFVGAIVTSRMSLVWTTVMLSAPRSNLSWDTFRNTTWSQAGKTLPAIILCFWVLQLFLLLPLWFKNPGREEYSYGRAIIYFFLSIPATIVLIRVQVTLISDEFRFRIPCDRTFGQDTSSTNGKLTLMMAVKTLDVALVRRGYACMAKCLITLVSVAFVYYVFSIFVLLAIPY